MECKFISTEIEILLRVVGTVLLFGGWVGLVTVIVKALTERQNKNGAVDQGDVGDIGDVGEYEQVRPIPNVRIVWGRCGPQPPGFREGTEVLCPKCKARVEETGEMTYCATLIPYYYEEMTTL